MKRTKLYLLVGAVPALALTGAALTASADSDGDKLRAVDPSGVIRTVTNTGELDLDNPFFKSMGTNGRSCVTCHQPGDAWSVTPEHLQQRFDRSEGLDPIFRTNDGSNSPLANVSTVHARRKAYSMLLNRGVIRVGLPIPPKADYELTAVDDPYGYASAKELSLFRRPLPSTNLRFITGVMWDGRETIGKFVPGNPTTSAQTLTDSLGHQAIDATTGHAQASAPPTAEQVAQIIALETGLTTAQERDNDAGSLHSHGAEGGVKNLVDQLFYVGINDTLGADPTGAAFNPSAMSLYDNWADPSNPLDEDDHEGRRKEAREAVARGEMLFNTRPISITGVGGLNDALGKPVIAGTCTTCHSSPNVGNHSVALPLNIGLTDASRRTPDMPLYTLHHLGTNDFVQTTDPGKALLSGKWADIGKFKGPILRGLAARAPYFHNGFAASLGDVVDFYNTRFNADFTGSEKADLVAFLKTL